MRLPFTNTYLALKRRTAEDGKKSNVAIQSDISAYVSDTGTTEDGQQTYLIMVAVADLDQEINADTDTFTDSDYSYRIENISKKEYHYSIRAVRV